MDDLEIKASWDDNPDEDAASVDLDDVKQQFMSKIDDDIDFGARYEVVGCCELSAKSPAFGRFKIIYFFLCFAEQFGFYWITLLGTIQYGYEQWLDRYMLSLMIAGFISAFMSSFMGRLSDRFGRKFIILLSILIQSFPYLPLCVWPNKLHYFLYIIPSIGLCGSIATLTGVMKSYVVDCLPKTFLISAFAKLIAIYGGAGILSSIAISAIIGGELREFFTTQTWDITTQMIMYITVGAYLFTFLLFALLVPESLPPERRLKYDTNNLCHGISYALSNGVVIRTALFIFFSTFSLFGMISIVRDIFLIEFDLSNYGHMDLFTVSEYEGLNTAQTDPANIDKDAILSDDIIVYGGFLFSLGCTLICAPCCVKCCFCGKAITNMICSMMILMISYAIIIYLLLAPDAWWVFIVSCVCGMLFAFGEIGYAFVNGAVAKYINSKQYGIAYGLLHSVYSLAKAAAPYTFFIIFEMLTKPEYTPHQLAFGKAKSVVYVAIILLLIGTLIAIFGVKQSMKKHEESAPKQKKGAVGQKYDYTANEDVLAEGKQQNPGEFEVEMQPPPDAQRGYGHMAGNASMASSNVYVVGQPAPQYANQAYVARVSQHQPNWVQPQAAQQQAHVGRLSFDHVNSGSGYEVQSVHSHRSFV